MVQKFEFMNERRTQKKKIPIQCFRFMDVERKRLQSLAVKQKFQ
jgi:hypothetical protein